MNNFHLILLFSYYFSISVYLCYSEELFDLSCTENSHCKQFKQHHMDIDVSCVEGYCECRLVSTGARVGCEPKAIKISNVIGGACPCKQTNWECNVEEGICYCAKDYVPSVDRRSCIKETVELGAACKIDTQCTMSKVGNHLASCNLANGLCQCSEGFVEHNDECLAIVHKDFNLNTTCHSDVQCHEFEPESFCHTKEKLCLCPWEFVGASNKTKCIRIADYGEDCDVRQQCQRKLGAAAICDNGMCRCDKNHFPMQLKVEDGSIQTICKREVVIGSYCRKEEQCYQQHLQESEQSMTCCKGECNCKYGYDTYNTNCLRASSVSPLLPGSTFGFIMLVTTLYMN